MGVVEKYLKKGAKVYIEGRTETRKWTDKAGQDNYTTEIVLRPYSGELLMLDRRNGDEPAAADAGSSEAPTLDDENPA